MNASIKIGSYVYRPYSPVQIGKIIEMVRKDNYYVVYRVHWINGKITEEEDWDLNDFEKLIEDHEKKLKTHRDRLAKLKSVVG